MAWIEMKHRKDGTCSYWIRDKRDGHAVVIPGGANRLEAESELEKYKVRHQLEKDGYGDPYSIIDGIIQDNVRRLKDGRQHGRG